MPFRDFLKFFCLAIVFAEYVQLCQMDLAVERITQVPSMPCRYSLVFLYIYEPYVLSLFLAVVASSSCVLAILCSSAKGFGTLPIN